MPTAMNFITYLLTYFLYSVVKTGRGERELKRPSPHDGGGRGALKFDSLSFFIIGGEDDFLLEPLHAGESREAAHCLPKHAAYVGRRRPEWQRMRSVSRLISCSSLLNAILLRSQLGRSFGDVDPSREAPPRGLHLTGGERSHPLTGGSTGCLGSTGAQASMIAATRAATDRFGASSSSSSSFGCS